MFSGILFHLNIHRLVIILHIDEYQEIFTFENNKGLFKEMMLTLGPLMTESNSEYYVQTFLLGTVT